MTFFIPINANNLRLYFNRGIILPYNLLNANNYMPDFQKFKKNFIILSNKKWVKTTDCCLEVYVTDEEVKNHLTELQNTQFFLCNIPIPITRLRSIIFTDNDKKKAVLFNINEKTAFIPIHLSKIESKDSSEIEDENELPEIIELNELPEIVEKTFFFDQLLGGIALMRTSGGKFMNYSEKYFSTLSFFNKKIRDEFENARSEKADDRYWLVFQKNDMRWKNNYSIFYDIITPEKVKLYVDQRRQNDPQKYINLYLGNDIDKLNTFDEYIDSFYALILLLNYNDKSLPVKSLLSVIANNKIPQKRMEVLTLLLGINYGYAKFENKYNFFDKDIKFRFDSQLDYYTVESIFQYSFFGKNDCYEFSFIDGNIPKYIEDKDLNSYKSYKIIDKYITYDKNIEFGSSEYINNLLNDVSYYKFSKAFEDTFNDLHFKDLYNGRQFIIDKFNYSLSGSFKELTKTICNKIIADFINKDSNHVKNDLSEFKRTDKTTKDLEEEISKLKTELKAKKNNGNDKVGRKVKSNTQLNDEYNKSKNVNNADINQIPFPKK